MKRIVKRLLPTIGLLWLLSLSSCSDKTTESDPVARVADPNLEARIRVELNKPSGDLRISELSSIIDLMAENSGIDSLNGIEQCANLTELCLGDNRIKGLENLRRLTKLEVLHLFGNEISDISPLDSLTRLRELRLGDNQVVDLTPLAGLDSLRELYLNNNGVSDISPLAELTGLTTLNLYRNNISAINPLTQLMSLRLLNLFANEITDISPLVANSGLGVGDTVVLIDNPLSEQSLSVAVPQLQERGVIVLYYSQQGAPVVVGGDTLWARRD
jgi:Leucine-rich repeat (LRR) protein